MSEPFVFDPRCELCKAPFGAVPVSQTITLHCRPLSDEQFTHCALVLHQEFSGQTQEQELTWEAREAERERFGLTFTAPAEPELVWYHFRFWRDDGSGCVLDKSGYRSDGQVEPWQLTVYCPSKTPAWFGQGITYQIFPDRFCRLPDDPADPTGLIGDRIVHRRWNEIPEWRPDAHGEIRNRDFFGGTLRGIASKLPVLESLGVTTIYLNPIFEAASNHRYNTADYMSIDPMLGTEEDFTALCQKAHDLGMRVILDGVFNHTGSQSRYFNADGYYPTLGAAQSQDSPYYDWFSFHPWPEDYDSWWGIKTLPAVREEAPSYVDYIVDGPDSVVRHWLRAGADGWRLDVADELPDWFIEKIRTAMAETKPGAFLLGEVWEDASNKVAYSQRRKYLLGHELHGVMNYPFRNALLAYLLGGSADDFRETMETLRENYPPDAFNGLMNFLGTHDTARILSILGRRTAPASRAERAVHRLSPVRRRLARSLLKLATLVLFTFPGSPTIYYGDELGMEGWEDPFNRGTMPWGTDSHVLLPWFRKLGRLRRNQPPLFRGSLQWIYTDGPLLVYAREADGRRLVTAVNVGDAMVSLSLDWTGPTCRDLLTGASFSPEGGHLALKLPPRTGFLLG